MPSRARTLASPPSAEREIRRRAAQDAAWQAEADRAHHMAQAAIGGLTAAQPHGDAEGVALGVALHVILLRMKERGDFTTRGGALALVEETLATMTPGPWVVAG